jgi:AcrR family transcriptional regulator
MTAATVDLRAVILDAADRLMARYGFRRITMDDIAKEAGIAKRTIYLRFSSKEEVGLSSIGRVVEDAQRAMDRIAQSADDAPKKLRKMLLVRVMGRVHAVRDYTLALDELFEAVRPAYMERRKAYFDTERDLLSGVLEAGKAGGAFTFSSARETAAILIVATNAYLPYSLSVRELGSPEKIEADLSLLVDLLIRGLSQTDTKP